VILVLGPGRGNTDIRTVTGRAAGLGESAKAATVLGMSFWRRRIIRLWRRRNQRRDGRPIMLLVATAGAKYG
jgi:hypothetical protein